MLEGCSTQSYVCVCACVRACMRVLPIAHGCCHHDFVLWAGSRCMCMCASARHLKALCMCTSITEPATSTIRILQVSMVEGGYKRA